MTGNNKKLQRAQARELDRLEVIRLRAEKKQKKQKAAADKKTRRAQLATLSRQDAKAYRIAEKEAKHAARLEARTRLKREKAHYLTLDPAEKKIFRREKARIRRLKRRAASAASKAVKYVLLAALIGCIMYAGKVAYSALIDHTAAFGDTAKVSVTTPAPTDSPALPEATEAPMPEPTVDPYELLLSQADLDFMKGRVNLLVLGIDESIERSNWGSFRTDTMILVSIDFETKDIHMISLPRDSFVWIYGTDERERINTAFAKGGGYKKNGFQYAMNTVSMVLGGVPVNHYVCFDMNVVKEVVDAFGGLVYDVDIKVRMGGRRIEPGVQHMDGQMVLDYCRQRKGDSDISRADRQQRMILAILDELKKTGQLKDVPAIYRAVSGNIYTDLTFEQIAALSVFGLGIEPESIQRHMLPGGFLNIDGTSLWGINQNQTKRLVKDIFGVNINARDTDDLAYLRTLAAEKRQAVAVALALVAEAEAYMNDPDFNTYAQPEEKTQLASLIQQLRLAAAVKNTHDVESTIPPITQGIEALSQYRAAVITAVSERKQAAQTMPTPETSPAPEPAP